MNLLEIFAPYLGFISLFSVLIFNTVMIFKGVNWVSIIIGNIILTLLLQFFGFQPFDLITQVVTQIVTIIIDLITALIDSFIEGIRSIFG